MGWQYSPEEVQEFLAARPQTCGCRKRSATFVVTKRTGMGGYMFDVCAWCLVDGSGDDGEVEWTWTPEHAWRTPPREAGAVYRNAFRDAVTMERPGVPLPDERTARMAWEEFMPVGDGPATPIVPDVQTWVLWMLTPGLRLRRAKEIVREDWERAMSWQKLRIHGWITNGLPPHMAESRSRRRHWPWPSRTAT
jgi:hypothetical protein